MKTTSLKTSQLLKAAGVECESEFVHINSRYYKGVYFHNEIALWDDDNIVIAGISNSPKISIKKVFPAYTLQELVPVLKELEDIIKNDTKVRKNIKWEYEFAEICKLYAAQGFEAVDTYIQDLLK